MSIDTIVAVNISLAAPPLTGAGFGIGLLFLTLTAPQDALWDSVVGAGVVTAPVTPTNYVAFLESVGITDSDTAFALVQDHFSQTRQPEQAILARRSTPVAQVSTFEVADSTDGLYSITVETAAESFTASFTASGNTLTEIRDALESQLSGSGLPITFATVGGAQITATANTAGVPIVASSASPVTGGITIAVTTPNNGITDDLADANAERQDWYLVLKDDRVDDVSAALAIDVESFPRDIIAMLQTSNAGAQSTATDDLQSLLRSQRLTRSAVWWHTPDTQGVDFAIAGKQLPTDPGSTTWANQELASVVGIDASGSLTDEAALLSKGYNYLERFAALNTQITRNARMADGTFIDLIRGRDALKDAIQVAVLQLLRDEEKVPYTDEGAAQVGAVIGGVLANFAADGLLVEDTIQVNVPRVNTQDPTDRANRCFGGITFSATLQGAIHKLEINGTLTP